MQPEPKPQPTTGRYNVPALVECYGGRGPMNLYMHINRDPGFIYFTNPKVACSSTKASLNVEVARRSDTPLKLASMIEVHLREKNPLLSPNQIPAPYFQGMMTDPEVVRFSFVRDPLQRFCSAYLSKLAENRRNSRLKFRLTSYLKRTDQAGISVEEFARLCRDDPTVRDFDGHWRLQRNQIAFDLVDYTFVGNQKTFADDFRAVSRRIFGEEIPMFDTRTAFGRKTRSAKLADGVISEVRADVEAAYADDYRMIEEIRDRGLDRLDA